MLACEEFTKLVDCGSESERSTSTSLPFFVTDATGALEELRWRLFGAQPLLSRGKACAARHDWAYSSARARRELGYEWLPWKDVLARTVAWMKEQGWVGKRRA